MSDIFTILSLITALKYLKKSSSTAASTFSIDEFEDATGANANVTHEHIISTLDELFKQYVTQLKSQRYRLVPKLLGIAMQKLKWGDGSVIKTEFDQNVLKLIGPKGEQDENTGTAAAAAAASAKPIKPAAAAKTNGSTATAAAAAAANSQIPSSTIIPSAITVSSDIASASSSSASSSLNVNGDGGAISIEDSFVDDGRDIPESRNTAEQIAANHKVTGGHMLTRFPPEPNGFLHIGHCKAMNFNFGIAKRNGGTTIMRFDDTNPEAEKQIYIDNILENLSWLGHKPCKITFSSDYFYELYTMAIKLIESGKAYVDHQTALEIKEYRSARKGSPWRDRPITENLRLFKAMRAGLFDEGTATLRLKGDLQHANPQMSGDIIAYRIKYIAHPHVGNEWCIYPSYDYTHW